MQKYLIHCINSINTNIGHNIVPKKSKLIQKFLFKLIIIIYLLNLPQNN